MDNLNSKFSNPFFMSQFYILWSIFTKDLQKWWTTDDSFCFFNHVLDVFSLSLFKLHLHIWVFIMNHPGVFSACYSTADVISVDFAITVQVFDVIVIIMALICHIYVHCDAVTTADNIFGRISVRS